MPHHEMRRQDRRITDRGEIDGILRAGRFCSIATCADGAPYVFTMSYGYDQTAGRLYFHSAAEGRKIDALRSDPRVCATVIVDLGYKHGECAHPYRSAVVFGTMRVVEDAEEKLHGLRVLVEHLEEGPDAVEQMGLHSPERVATMTALALDITSVSAKEGE